MAQTDPEELMPPEDLDPKKAKGYIPPTRHQPGEKTVHSAFKPEPVKMTPGEAAIRDLKAQLNQSPGHEYAIAEIKRKREKKDREDSSS